MDEETLKELCDRLRTSLKGIEVEVRRLKDSHFKNREDAFAGQTGEMIAQSMLAVRDIEAARMRLGKVLQYAGDGVSIYDKA